MKETHGLNKPAAGSPDRLSGPADSPAQLVSAEAPPSAPPAAHATDSSPASSPSGSAHVLINLSHVFMTKQKQATMDLQVSMKEVIKESEYGDTDCC